jgi:hypothetical protein
LPGDDTSSKREERRFVVKERRGSVIKRIRHGIERRLEEWRRQDAARQACAEFARVSCGPRLSKERGYSLRPWEKNKRAVPPSDRSPSNASSLCTPKRCLEH